jgi:hypothetical protein
MARSIAFTWSRSRRVTTPRRRYQIPSPVSHTSSASTVVSFVNRIVTCPRLVFSSPPVDTGLPLRAATRADSAWTPGDGITLGEGDGSGDGDGLTEGEGREGSRGICCCATVPFDVDSLAL